MKDSQKALPFRYGSMGIRDTNEHMNGDLLTCVEVSGSRGRLLFGMVLCTLQRAT